MNALRPALLSLFVLAPSVPAEAHPQVMKGGHVEDPPGPEKHQDLQQRRAVRGCPVGEPCRGELLRGLHEFELEAFPRPGRDGPWFDGNDPHGHARVRSGLGADDRARRHAVRRPSELRPDLPWLDKLKLPDIPVHWDHRIIKYLEFYRYDPRGRNIMSAWLRDQGKYKHIILKELRRAKLPEALLYIAMIESSYDPHEYSRTGASGLWQFMPASGRIYGMKQDRWLDERNDPVIATKAVTYYFRDLYERFGDWDLALAAFNAGYGAVIKGIAKYNTNDFWTLLELENALPWESARYVPKFLAAAIVGENLQRFGYSDVEVAPPVSWDLVSVGKSTPLKTIAKAAKTTLETIQRLNPQLRRKRTPPGKKSYRVRIPRGAKESFARAIPQLRSEWDDVDAYVVKHGERFEDIAMTHGLSRRKLRAMNGLKSENEVRGGMLLVVPVVSEAEKRENRQKAQEDLYRSGVPRGDGGEKLLVAVPDPEAAVPDKKRWFYRVVAGDTQSGVAAAFGVSRHDLARWNGLDPEAFLHPRMVLQVWTPSAFAPAQAGIAILAPERLRLVRSGSSEHLDIAEHRMGRKRLRYSPKRPESLDTIGKRFGLTRYDLARINRLPPDTIVAPGEPVLVYKVVDSRESERAAGQAKAARRARRRAKKKR